MPTQPGLLDRLSQGVVLGAEGYVFELERRGYIKAGPFVPEVVLDYPDALRELHREFLRAGAEVMVALTYYGDREKLKTIGREGDLEALNRQAVRLAKEIAAEGNALVAGNICNTWVYDHNDKEATSKKVRQIYTEQVGWAVDEGVDFIIAETLDYLGEGLLALEVIQEFGLPAMVTFGSAQDRTARRLHLRRGVQDHGARGRPGRRPELLARPGDDAAPAAGHPPGGELLRRRPAGALPHHAGAVRLPGAARSRATSAPSPSPWSRSCAPASRWPISPPRPTRPGSTTSASAAAARRTTCAPWPRRSAAPRPPAATRPPSTCTR